MIDLLVSHKRVPGVSLGDNSDLQWQFFISVGAELGHLGLIPEEDRPWAVATTLKIDSITYVTFVTSLKVGSKA